MKSLRMTRKEMEKVTHDINNVWHKRYKDKTYCRIATHSNKINSPSYVYHFINKGYNEYEFVAKYPTPDRR